MGRQLRRLLVWRYRMAGVQIGKNCFISLGAWLDERRGAIILGDNVSITRDAKILSHDATSSRLLPGDKGEYTTILEDNVFIGMGAIVLAGITIGKNSIVGAGAVVTKDVPADSIVAGNPATIIKRRDPQSGLWRKNE